MRTRAVLVLVAAAAAGCNVNRALVQVHDAQRLAADVSVQFTKAADASNLAVMADTDSASSAFVREAEARVSAAQNDVEALGPLLDGLGFTEESNLLGEFRARFDEYRRLDRTILDLAIENSNLKAQRLSFGEAREAADAVGAALLGLGPPSDSKEAWRVRALAAEIVAETREIEALQAPHIAEPDDARMAALEHRMIAAEQAARDRLRTLSGVAPAASRPKVAAATAALDRLVAVNQQIVTLSRGNTNVRSVALSLTEKRPVVAACEDRLHALRTALAKRGYVSRRY